MGAFTPPPHSRMFQRYARRRGLSHYNHWSLPPATQLLRQGFIQEVANAANGELPGGLTDSWIAHYAYSQQGVRGLGKREFTVVVTHVPKSIGFAARVLCHDRGLTEREMENPRRTPR